MKLLVLIAVALCANEALAVGCGSGMVKKEIAPGDDFFKITVNADGGEVEKTKKMLTGGCTNEVDGNTKVKVKFPDNCPCDVIRMCVKSKGTAGITAKIQKYQQGSPDDLKGKSVKCDDCDEKCWSAKKDAEGDKKFFKNLAWFQFGHTGPCGDSKIKMGDVSGTVCCPENCLP